MKEIIRKLILCVCVCVFVYSAYQLGCIFYDYYQIEKQTNELVVNYVEEPVEKEDPMDRVVEFKKLKELNKDVIGWIYVPNTNIDEPILKGENNDSYLYTDVYKKSNKAGALFVDERNKSSFEDNNTIVYGHNMKNGSRFHHIKKFLDKDFFDENPYVYIYKPDGSIFRYSVFSIKIIDARSELYDVNIAYNKLTSMASKNAKQKRKIANEQAQCLMMSTCVGGENDTSRFVLFARLEKVKKSA